MEAALSICTKEGGD